MFWKSFFYVQLQKEATEFTMQTVGFSSFPPHWVYCFRRKEKGGEEKCVPWKLLKSCPSPLANKPENWWNLSPILRNALRNCFRVSKNNVSPKRTSNLFQQQVEYLGKNSTYRKNLFKITLHVPLGLEKLMKDSTKPTSWRLFLSLYRSNHWMVITYLPCYWLGIWS